MVDAKRKLHEQDPSTHINARTPPTRIEGLLLQKLAEWGFNAVHNRSFSPTGSIFSCPRSMWALNALDRSA